MNNKLVIVFDCGATNVRVVAINQMGQIEAKFAMPNNTQADPNCTNGLIWNTEDIWQKFVLCTRNILPKIDTERISAITVTTFGVNGAPVDKTGKLLYPTISWQCQRTVPVMDNIEKYMVLKKLYEISGVNKFSFNTINTLVWLNENHPEIIKNMEGFLFIPSIFIHKLTGNLVNDTTMAGTSMLTDLKSRSMSTEILSAIQVPNRFFAIKEPGTIAGELTSEASDLLGLPEGIPVVLAGHDTQFAVVGSGAGENDAVLSSGTWEILMTRSKNAWPNNETFTQGVTHEFDAVPGLLNTGAQWLGSGILEWIKKIFYQYDMEMDDNIYETMISEAMTVNKQGSKVSFSPDFVNHSGGISGIGLHTTRQEIYLAALESLVVKTKQNLNLIEHTGQFKANSLIVVGGGSKNRLWNQLRANTLGIPVKIAEQTETTVLGASLFAHTAAGNFTSVNQGIENICKNYKTVNPN